jgi:hypothetical protein
VDVAVLKLAFGAKICEGLVLAWFLHRIVAKHAVHHFPGAVFAHGFPPDRSLPLKIWIGSPNLTLASQAQRQRRNAFAAKSSRPRTLPSAAVVEVLNLRLSPSSFAVIVSTDFFTTVCLRHLFGAIDFHGSR